MDRKIDTSYDWFWEGWFTDCNEYNLWQVRGKHKLHLLAIFLAWLFSVTYDREYAKPNEINSRYTDSFAICVLGFFWIMRTSY
jgi:hypothetical protein